MTSVHYQVRDVAHRFDGLIKWCHAPTADAMLRAPSVIHVDVTGCRCWAGLLVATVRARIDYGIRARERRLQPKEVQGVFKQHAALPTAGGGQRLPADQLSNALQQLGLFVDETEARNYLLVAGGDQRSLGLDEFQQAAQGKWAGEVWAQSLPLAQLLSDALPDCAKCHRLRAISSLTAKEIRAVVEGFSEALERVLTERVESLRKSLLAMDEYEEGPRPNRKFQVVSMSCGRIEDFHGGVTKRIGELSLGGWFAFDCCTHCLQHRIPRAASWRLSFCVLEGGRLSK